MLQKCLIFIFFDNFKTLFKDFKYKLICYSTSHNCYDMWQLYKFVEFGSSVKQVSQRCMIKFYNLYFDFKNFEIYGSQPFVYHFSIGIETPTVLSQNLSSN